MTILIPRGKHITDLIDLRMQNIHEDLLIILESSSSATIIHGSNSSVRDSSLSRKIHCILHENSTLNFRYDEKWHESMHVNVEVLVEQKLNSMLKYTHYVQTDAQITQQFSLHAVESGAHADIRGIYQIRGKGSVTMTTMQYHDASHTVSNLHIRGILDDVAQMHHHGTINITKNGAHTESAQRTHLLLLSEHARATSVPNIEVLTHEVQCAHGSAIGKLDEEQLWYLQARGLPRDQAEQLLINGFLNHLL